MCRPGTGQAGPYNRSSPSCSAVHWPSGDAWCRESVCGKCPGWPHCNGKPPGPPPAPLPLSTSTLLRKAFVVHHLREVARAVVYVVGLGYYKLYVDGVQASTHELGTFTNFATRCVSHRAALSSETALLCDVLPYHAAARSRC